MVTIEAAVCCVAACVVELGPFDPVDKTNRPLVATYNVLKNHGEAVCWWGGE